MDKLERDTTRRLGRWMTLLVVVAVAAGTAWLAGRAALQPTGAEQIDPGGGEPVELLVAAAGATVGQSVVVNVEIVQLYETAVTNAKPGVITRLGDVTNVDVGTILYYVDEVPIRAVLGDVPFYRDLAYGATGRDVVQLRAALAQLGLFRGPAEGNFSRAVERAVSEWQRQLGLPRTGTVVRGELVAMAVLPASLTTDPGVKVGSSLSGGESVNRRRAGEPKFSMTLSDSQVQLIRLDEALEVEFGPRKWPAVVGDQTQSESGGAVFEL